MLNVLLLSLALLAPQATPATSQVDARQVSSLRREITELAAKVNDLESDLSDKANTGALVFLFGAFCALWAQNSGRSPWAWFFAGAFFHVITVLVLLSRNAQDRRT